MIIDLGGNQAIESAAVLANQVSKAADESSVAEKLKTALLSYSERAGMVCRAQLCHNTKIHFLCAPFLSPHLHLDHFEPNKTVSRRQKRNNRSKHATSAKQLQPKKITVLARDDGASHGAAQQGAEGLDRKGSADAGANLASVGNLGDDGRGEGEVAARGEAKDDGEGDDAGGGFDGDPDGEAE